jgi:hypothetical protein
MSVEKEDNTKKPALCGLFVVRYGKEHEAQSKKWQYGPQFT